MDTLKYLDAEAANAEVVRRFLNTHMETVLSIIEGDGFGEHLIESAVISGYADVADALVEELDDKALLELLVAEPELLDIEPDLGASTVRGMIHRCLRERWSLLSDDTIEDELQPRVIQAINERYPGALSSRGMKY